MKLDRSRAALVVVDVQEAFRPAVLDFEQVVGNVSVLVRGAGVLGLPTLVTEQYPKGLGHTVPEVAEHLDEVDPIEKVCFSAVQADGFSRALQDGRRDQVLLCGIETHVCVNQTAEDLLVERLTAGGGPYGLRPPALEKNAPANLCLVDLDARWTVGEAGYESRSDNSCFAGRELHGRVLMTLAGGAVAYRDRGFSIRLAADPGLQARGTA